MRRESSLIKDFSKEKNQENRDKTAQDIRSKRTEYFSNKEERKEWQGEKDNLQEDMESSDLEIQEKVESLNDLRDDIERLSSNLPKKLWNHFKIKNIKSKLAIGKKSYEELKTWHDGLLEQDNVLESNLSEENISDGDQEAQKILNNFYREQENQWANSEYNKEDINKHFSEENLASLSIEDYILLLKRFPGNMVTHVTRQGIRDHTGHMYHTAGKGEYSDGFKQILESGKLFSILNDNLTEKEKRNLISEFLLLEECENREEALENLEATLGRVGGHYSDRTSVHFATEEVADKFYGGEKGNEIFFTYPSLYISSQYSFQGNLVEGQGHEHNDQWVWMKEEEKGMNINAGIVFIPKESQVDKRTGSVYELDEDSDPIINQEYKDLVKNFIDSEDFSKLSDEIMEITNNSEIDYLIRLDEATLSEEDREKLNVLNPFRKEIENTFNIKDRKLQNVLFGYQNLDSFQEFRKENIDKLDSPDEKIEKALNKNGVLYKRAEDVVDSEKYWEDYFKKYPGKKPSKIVYYKAKTPTIALEKWREDNSIKSEQNNIYLESSENRTDSTFPEVNEGRDELYNLAIEVINDHFDKKEKVA
jgi:hypothetical protein